MQLDSELKTILDSHLAGVTGNAATLAAEGPNTKDLTEMLDRVLQMAAMLPGGQAELADALSKCSSRQEVYAFCKLYSNIIELPAPAGEICPSQDYGIASQQ